MIRRLLTWLPWVSLCGTGTILLLILRQSPPLPVQIDPHAAERVADKMAQLQVALEAGQRQTIALNETELNQWMRDNLAVASVHQARQAGIPAPNGAERSMQEVQSALKDVRVNLAGNLLKAYALFQLYGTSISLQLNGTLDAQDGYLRLKPTSGTLGSLPIPTGTLEHVVRQLFDSPQNRHQFELPPNIAAIRIENAALIITTR